MTILRSISASYVTRTFLAASLAYIALARATDVKPLGEALRVIQMTLAAAVTYAYMPNALRTFVTPGWPKSEDLIALGIAVSWFSVALNGAWALLYRLSGQPLWMINNDFYNSWVALNAVAAIIHVISPNLVGEGVPRGDKIRLWSAWIAAALIIVGLGIYKPNLSGFTEMIRPYVIEGDDQGSGGPEP